MRSILLVLWATLLVASPAAAQPCPAGSHSPSGVEPCLLCLPGSFAAGTGSTSCTACSAGTFSDDSGATACDPCPPGTSSPAGASACTPASTTTTLPNPCSPNPCLNGGLCLATDSGGYLCICPAGISGINCEIGGTTSTTSSTTTTTSTTTSAPTTTTSTTATTTTTTTTSATTSTTTTTTTVTTSTSATTATSTTATTSTTTTIAPLCGPLPATGCRLGEPGRSLIRIKDVEGSTRDQLKWKWIRGDATDVNAFKNPVSGSATYRVCLYDASSDPQPLLEADIPPVGTCAGRPCWKAAGQTGFSYRNRAGTADGVTGLRLKAGASGRAKLQLKAKGASLQTPALGLTMPATMQLVIRDGVSTECWQTKFPAAYVNTTSRFYAKGP